MGSLLSRAFQSNEISGKTCSSDISTARTWRKKKIVPHIHIATPTILRRRAAFIKHEKTHSTDNIDRNKLWINWAPRRFSWPNAERRKVENRRNEEFPNDG